MQFTSHHSSQEATKKSQQGSRGFERPPCVIASSSGKQLVLLEPKPDVYVQVRRKRPARPGADFDIVSDTAFVEASETETTNAMAETTNEGKKKKAMPTNPSNDDWILVTQSPKKKMESPKK